MIPVNEPLLDGSERAFLLECVESGWISSEGPFVARFEAEFAARMGRRHGIAVCNGTAALDAAMAALRIGPGDEVIMPTFTIISCINQIVRSGAKPVLVDSDPLTWNLDTNGVEAKITERTKAIMAVHIYGMPTDMAPLMSLADHHKLLVIEDAAEAQGQYYGSRPCGSFGNISTFSFYSNKVVTTGEGGMILTDDDALAERCRSLRNLCFQPGRRFVHDELGWNMRMTNLQAGLGLAQLQRIDSLVARKRHMGRRYSELLEGDIGIQLPVASTSYAENSYWVYGLVLGDSLPFDAAEVIKRLAAAGVEARPFFWCMHEQPVLRRMGLFSDEHYPVAERIARRGLYLPGGLALTDTQIEQVASAVRESLR